MKKVSLFFFALALSLSAIVVNAQPGTQNTSRVFTEQQMSNINPSSWTTTFKTSVWTALGIAFGRAETPQVATDPERIARALVASLTAQQKTPIEATRFSGSSSSGRNQGPLGADTRISCSGLKYADFWSVLGLCKN